MVLKLNSIIYSSMLEFRTPICRPILLNSENFGNRMFYQKRKVRKFWKTHVFQKLKVRIFWKIIPYFGYNFENALDLKIWILCFSKNCRNKNRSRHFAIWRFYNPISSAIDIGWNFWSDRIWCFRVESLIKTPKSFPR